jgi:hypothetical protein
LRFCPAIRPGVDDQINQEQSLENSLRMENAKRVDANAMGFTGAENNSEKGG